MSRLDEVLRDLRDEGDQLEAVVAGLEDGADRGWRTPTPAPGWDVAHQVAHLAWTDESALAAATDQVAWDATVLRAIAHPEGLVDDAAERGAAVPTADLLQRWRASRAALAAALAALPEDARLPWFGPPMSVTSMATARFMETWAHARDVAAALGVALPVDDRVRHVVHLGVRTRGFAFANRGLAPPTSEIRVSLTLPSGGRLDYGAEQADQSVAGPAYDFARLVTQRVHRADTALVAAGEDAERWLGLAQAFAGPPGAGRAAR